MFEGGYPITKSRRVIQTSGIVKTGYTRLAYNIKTEWGNVQYELFYEKMLGENNITIKRIDPNYYQNEFVKNGVRGYYIPFNNPIIDG